MRKGIMKHRRWTNDVGIYLESVVIFQKLRKCFRGRQVYCLLWEKCKIWQRENRWLITRPDFQTLDDISPFKFSRSCPWKVESWSMECTWNHTSPTPVNSPLGSCKFWHTSINYMLWNIRCHNLTVICSDDCIISYHISCRHRHLPSIYAGLSSRIEETIPWIQSPPISSYCIAFVWISLAFWSCSCLVDFLFWEDDRNAAADAN